MNLATRTAVALALCSALFAVGCGSSEPEQPETATPQQEPETPAQPAGPEIIDQAGGEQVSPIDNPLIDKAEDSGVDAADDSEAGTSEGGEPEQSTANPVTSLPGFSPASNTPPSAAALAANAGTDQVLVQVSVFELTPKAAEDLAPIEQFLGGDVGSLSPDEAGAFMELVGALGPTGVIDVISSPRVLVASGLRATIEITQLGGGQVNGVPTARSSLLFSTAPTVRRSGDDDETASVDMSYELKFAQADSAFQVDAQDLGLNLGPRASGAGTVTVGDQQTFFFVRKVVGEDSSRELLVLVRPQVMKADLTK